MSSVLEPSTVEPVEDKIGESMWSKAAYKFRRDRTGMMGLYVVFFLYVSCTRCRIWTLGHGMV